MGSDDSLQVAANQIAETINELCGSFGLRFLMIVQDNSGRQIVLGERKLLSASNELRQFLERKNNVKRIRRIKGRLKRMKKLREETMKKWKPSRDVVDEGLPECKQEWMGRFRSMISLKRTLVQAGLPMKKTVLGYNSSGLRCRWLLSNLHETTFYISRANPLFDATFASL